MEVHDAYNGTHFSIGVDFESLDALAKFLYQQTSVDPSRQLLLVSPSGNKLRLETIAQGQNIYMYDKQMISKEFIQPTEPQFATIDELPSTAGFESRASWAETVKERAKINLNWIRETKSEISTIKNSALLSASHMEIHIKSLRKSVAKKQHAYTHLQQDLGNCSNWETNWNKFSGIHGLGAKIDILDKTRIDAAWTEAQELRAEIDNLFVKLNTNDEPEMPAAPLSPRGNENILEKDMNALCYKITQDSQVMTRLGLEEYERVYPRIERNHNEIIPEIFVIHGEIIQLAQLVFKEKLESQDYLTAVVRKVSEIQTEHASVKPTLNQISEKLQQLDEAKTEVAKVIDFPFIYGVSLIEITRRRSWSAAIEHLTKAALAHFDHLRESEYSRIDRWSAHYSSLNMIEKLVSVDVKLPSVEINFEEMQFDNTPEILNYMSSLEEMGFGDVADDLRSELGAMAQQLEHSFRPTSKTQLLFPDINTSQVIREDQLKDKLRHEIEKAQAQPEREVRQRIESELRSQIENDLRHEIEDKIRSEVTSEVTAVVTAQVTAQVEARVQSASRQAEKDLEDIMASLDEQKRTHVDEISQRDEKIAELELQQREPEPAQALMAKGAMAPHTQELNHYTKEELERWVENLKDKTHDLGQRLYANSHNLEIVLAKMGLQTTRKVEEGMVIYSVNRVKGLSRRSSRSKNEVSGSSALLTSSEMTPPAPRIPDPSLLHWVPLPDNDDEFRLFIQEIYIDYDIFRQVVSDRFGEVEKIARKYHAEVKTNRERIRALEKSMRHCLALGQFKVGDLILFLPTRDSERTPNPWAAFNINSPHYFLDPSNAVNLGNREFLIGRATAIVQHNVSPDDPPEKNPFRLPEGLKWNMITANWK